MTQEIKNAVANVAEELKNVAGSKWEVTVSYDDLINFTHKDNWSTRYSISIKVFGEFDGIYKYVRDIEFGSVPSCGSFTTSNEEVFDLYSLVGKLVNYDRLEELKEKIKAIPFDND